MYESYWQLRQKPFENNADPSFYYPGESHQAALLKLRYAIENRRGGALLAGPSGCGKTLLANMLPATLGEGLSPLVHMVFPQMSTAELLAYLADELDGSNTTSATPGVQESVRRIQHFLADNTGRGRHAVIVIDEAHLLDNSHTLEALRLLLNFESGNQPGLTLLLVGQPGLLSTLIAHAATGRAAGREVSAAGFPGRGDGRLREPSAPRCRLVAADLRARQPLGASCPHPRHCPAYQSPLRFVRF